MCMVLQATTPALASCGTTSWLDDNARGRFISDERAGHNGIGPSPCHRASVRPDLDAPGC